MHPADQSPVNPLPTIVWVLFAAIVIPEALFSLGAAGMVGGPGAIGWRLAAINEVLVAGPYWEDVIRRGLTSDTALRFVAYPFVHEAFTSTLFAAVLLLALGKLVGEVMGQLAVAVVFVLSAIFGAVVFCMVAGDDWMVGAFPAVYGLIGSYTFLMWRRSDELGEGPARAFSLIGFLMGIQILFSLLFGGLSWVADLAGFFCGLVLSLVVVPGGLGRLRRLIQRK
ncbi:MAG: rhomboid family intramembrane serine protease [Pseudomonadota bacterium]